MLRGNYTARMDSKGRLKVPTAFRRYLEEKYGQQFYVTSLDGECVRIFPLPEWESIEQRLALLPSMDPARRKFLDRTNYYGQQATMDGQAEGLPVPTFLWRERGVVPFVKVDKGLEAEDDGVALMKPIPGLDELLARAASLGVFGTKERSVIRLPSRNGIAAVVAQQFELAERVAAHGLVPIVEPEVLIKSPDKAGAETILLEELTEALDALPEGRRVMLKLTIPDVPGFYSPLVDHPRVVRVVALSGGHTRAEACERLARNRGVIASFSRALTDDLRRSMSDAEFDAALERSITEIYQASAVKA